MTVTWHSSAADTRRGHHRETVGAFEYLYRALLLGLVIATTAPGWHDQARRLNAGVEDRVVRSDGGLLRWRGTLLAARGLDSVLATGSAGYFWMLFDRAT